MKNVTKITLSSIFMLFSFTWAFSQVITEINNMTYINGAPISNCGTIDFEANPTVRVQFTVDLDKPINQVVGDGFVYVYTKKTSSSYPQQEEIRSMPSNFWNDNTQTGRSTYTWSFDVEMNANNFNTTGGIFYALYKSSSDVEYATACNYSIIKDEVPTFTISPSNTSVTCDSASPKTFEVTNVYNSPGNLSFNWSVGSGWLYNGNAVSTFTTTTNTIQLTPYSYPPSNVSVTPVLDGVSYPVLTSNVSLAPYNPTNTIVGSTGACSTETYSISNLPNNVSVTSWVVSDTSIATVTNSSGNQTNLNVIGYGLITLTATLTNSCNQSASIPPLEIYVGRPATPTKISGPKTVGYGVLVNYSIAAIPGALEYEWRLPYPYQTVINFSYFGNSWQMLSSTSTTNSINAFSGYGGTSGYVQVSAKNNCGNGGTKYIFVTHSNIGGGQYPRIAPPNDEDDIDNNTEITDNFSVFPNPAKDEIQINIGKFNKNTSYKIQLFDIKNVLIKEISVKNMKKKFSVKNLPNGVYILKFFANKKVSTKKIIISH